MLDDDKTPPTPPTPPENETVEERRMRRYYENLEARRAARPAKVADAKAKAKARKEQAAEEKKLKEQQQLDYPRLTPEEWKRKYNSDKPKIGLIDHDTAVKIISRRMTSLALHTLGDVCQYSRNDSARIMAAREILDRGWGKAHLQPEAEGRPGAEITITFGDAKTLEAATSPQEPDEPDDDDELDDETDDLDEDTDELDETTRF